MSNHTVIDLVETMFLWVTQDIAALSERIDEAQESHASQVAFAFPVEEFLADAPLAIDGMVEAENRWVADGRKSGESAGNGTGVPAFYDPSTNSWFSFLDGAAVVV